MMTKSEIVSVLKQLVDKIENENESILLTKEAFLRYLANEEVSPAMHLYIEVKGDNSAGPGCCSVKWLREHVTFNPNHLSCWMQIQSYNKKWRAWTGASVGDAPWDND